MLDRVPKHAPPLSLIENEDERPLLPMSGRWRLQWASHADQVRHTPSGPLMIFDVGWPG